MLERRRVCPACNFEAGEKLLDIAYAKPEIFEFLCAYYCHADPETIAHYVRGGMLTLIECGNCGLVYQRDIPDEDFMHELYENWILEGDELAPNAKPLPLEHYTYLASEIAHLLAEQRRAVGQERSLRVLDFGMGWSAWLKMARAYGADVYGAELSQSKVAYARSIGIPVLTLGQISSTKFDLIGTEQVFEHLPNPASLLELLVASLEPTGYLKISVPSGDSVKSVISRWKWKDAFARKDEIMPAHPLEHINCFSSRSLDIFAARYGLERAPLSPWRAMAYSVGWHTPRSAVKNLLRPIYRFGLKRGTYAIYRRASARTTAE